MTLDESVSIVSSWLDCTNVAIVEPEARHWEILRQLLSEGQCVGPLVTDATLAAIATEHGAVVHSTDRDFSRFSSVDWIDPIHPE